MGRSEESVSLNSERAAGELALTNASECYMYCTVGMSGDKGKTSVSGIC